MSVVKLQRNKSKGNYFWFAGYREGSRNRRFKELGFHCPFTRWKPKNTNLPTREEQQGNNNWLDLY